jgi:hypothetical protein
MKKNIIKPKFYTLDKGSVKQPSTGYIFFKHYPPKLNQNNENKKLTLAVTKLYYSNEKEKFNNQYIQIAERQEKMDNDDFIQYLIINYKIPKSGFKLKKIVNSDNLVVYLVYLNIDTKLSLYYESILELINKERLSKTDNYWGLLSTAFINTRKFYLNRCLYTNDNTIKLEMRFKKVYKALIEI